MRWFRTLGYALLQAMSSLGRRPFMSAITVCVMTLSLLLVGATHLVERNVRMLSDAWGGGVQLIVYLEDGTSEGHAVKIAEALRQIPVVQKVAYVPPEEAMVHLRRSLGKHDELLLGIQARDLPASLEIRLEHGVRDLVAVHPLVKRLKATSGVEDVESMGHWVDNFRVLIDRVQRAGLYVVLFACLFGVFTVVATMRLSASSRMAEMRVLSLIGAPGIFVHGPLLMEGAMLGLLATAFATGLLFVLFQSASTLVAHALFASFGVLEFHFLSPPDVVQLAFFGTSLGLVGGMLSNYRRGR